MGLRLPCWGHTRLCCLLQEATASQPKEADCISFWAGSTLWSSKDYGTLQLAGPKSMNSTRLTKDALWISSTSTLMPSETGTTSTYKRFLGMLSGPFLLKTSTVEKSTINTIARYWSVSLKCSSPPRALNQPIPSTDPKTLAMFPSPCRME